MGKNWDNFWKNLNKTMDGFGDAIDDFIIETTNDGDNSSGFYKKSTSVTIQNGKKVVVTTVNGKTTVRVDGKEYVKKSKEQS